MKITIFIGGLTGGGAERVACNLANALAKHHAVVLLVVTDDHPADMLNRNVSVVPLIKAEERKSFLCNFIKRLKRLCKYLKRSDTDMYVVMLPITTILLLMLRSLTKAKVIAAERNNPSSYSSKKQKALLYLAHKADAWIFQTEEQRIWYGTALRNHPTVVIPNAINPKFLHQVPMSSVRKPIIVTAGRMTPQKNQALLIRAFRNIQSQFPELRLIIYGEGPLRDSLESLATELQIHDFVSFPGYCANISEGISCASLFVLSSDYEGMPNALMEAMALGLPCISTECDGGGAQFLIENERNGVLVPKGDVEALTTAMQRMLSDRTFAERCGLEAHKICERLNPSKIYHEWATFIENIADYK